jgi:hypothetical protein
MERTEPTHGSPSTERRFLLSLIGFSPKGKGRGFTCDDAAGFFLWNAVAVWILANNASFRFVLMLCGVGFEGVGWLVGRDAGGGRERERVRLTRGSIFIHGGWAGGAHLGFLSGSCF